MVETGKLLAVCLLIFQIFTQPMAVLAQSKSGLSVNRSQTVQNKFVRSNVKPKVEETGSADLLPNLENKTRRAISNTFGLDIPFPQVFGEHGKLNSLFSNGDSATDKNKELIELALNNGNKKDAKSNPHDTKKTVGEAAISINAPTLNAGSIAGSLRVLKEIPFSINRNVRISRNLFTAGSPSISTGENSQIGNVINDEGDDLFNNYPIYLNGGKIGGDIYIHSSAGNIFEDIPSGLPKPSGNENVEINSAADLQKLKDWKTVRSLTVNAQNLTIEIPAGNYEKITLNAPNKLVFSKGVYNFSDTLDLQKGSAVEITGDVTVGIGKNLFVEDGVLKTAANILPENFKINVIGNSVVLSGKSEIGGLLRAMNANVVINENSKVTGQVIAGSLVLNGGLIDGITSTDPANNIAVVKEGLTHNGRIEGSVHQQLAQNTILNSNAVITGDLLVPGVPQITQNGAVNFGGTITGTGTATPTSHRLTLNTNSTLRKLKNRINPLTMPTVPTPPASPGTQSLTINNSSQYPTNFSNIRDITMNSGAGVLTLPPGTYRNLTINSGSGVKLGIAGETTPVTYNFNIFTVNSNSQIQIVSPVVINLGAGLTLNANAGIIENPEWLKLNVSSGNFTLNSNSNLYGGVIAPNSIITINSGTTLIGNVVCKKLIVNSGGLLKNVLPNLLSDTTVSITSPAANSTTSENLVTVTGTAQSSVGITNIYVNDQPASYNASNGNWTISNVSLVLGDNVITAKAVDALGTEITTQIIVTRQQAVTDTTAPVISISSPADNSTTQSETITVTGNAADPGTNASGLVNVKVNGQPAILTANGNWTISGIALNNGSNTITARATDNAGNYSDATVTVIRQTPDTTAPTLSIVSPANNSETSEATVTVSGTVSDAGENPSGVASVTVNGQAAAVNGNGWTIANVALTIGANTITANAIDNAGNSSNQQVTLTRIENDTTAPTITITSPANNSETNDTAITISGTATDSGANASGVATVTVNRQNAQFNNGSWTLSNVALNIGSNTITVRATDNAGNESSASIVVIRREPDTQPPTISITSPVDYSETLNATVTVSGTVVDSGENASGVASVIVNGIGAIITGSTWTAENVPLNIGSNTITATAKDINNNSAAASITVVRIPPDTQAPTLTIISPANNSETFDPQITVSGTVVDQGEGSTGVQSVVVNGITATYNAGANTWSGVVNLNDGVNTITVTATDNAPNPNQSQAAVQVSKLVIQPPTLTVTNPQNGAFLSADSITVAGSVFSNKPDMTFNVSVNGQPANPAGREFTKVLALTDGANFINVLATDALGQQAQQSITVTNDRTPPTVFLTNVPPVVNPGESYIIGATAFDAYGIADVEFTVNGASIIRSAVSPYQFTLNIPLNQAPNENLNISAIARDNAGLGATSTARIITSGPSGLTGYVFDDATGYILPEASARLNTQNPLLTDENGLYSFISNSASGNVLLSKTGYTAVERSYSAIAGTGVEIFDARLTPLDSKINTADGNGSVNASDSTDKIQAQFAPNSFPSGADVRLTHVSPQGLANLLPFGWSPIPEAVVDIRTADETGFSNRSLPNPADLIVSNIPGLAANIPVVLARYNDASHKWIVLQTDLVAGENGRLQASISSTGQYAFLVADTGATAPPNAVIGQELTSSAAANSEQLNSATASANASPATALYSSTAKSRINFLANSVIKLPSGISIEASFSDSYLTLIERSYILIDRPSQDFVLYSYPASSIIEPNKLSAFFVAKPIRTDFGLSDLLNAKIHVDISSGRISQTGILIGQTGGIVRGSEGSELEIPAGSVNTSQPVFFNKISNDQTGVILPEGYEIAGAFDVNLSGNTLLQSAKISMPALSGDNSKIVAAKVVSISGQPGLKVVARVIENNSRLESNISQPAVPAGVTLTGIRESGKYVFVKMPGDFGYINGTVSSSTPNTQSIKISNTNTPFVDLTANNGTYTILGLANGATIQVDGISLNNDATGYATTSMAAQDAVVNLPVSLASAVLNVLMVTPNNAASNVVVTTPVTVSFNKPVLSSTVTGSNIKLVTASGNPVITTITMLAGGRSVVLTPTSNLQSATDYKVKVSTGIRDIYGNALANNFESSFRTANQVTISNQLQPAQIRIAYPNEEGFAIISIPAGAVPVGSLILAINNSTGSTISTIAGSGAIELSIQARVGDEIELIIRQPDGSEYRVKQAAYRRADGFVSVGSNGGTITSDDGTLLLQIPAGAISGQADIKMTFAPESSIITPREGEMAPGEMNYIGGVKIETQGNFTNNQELHLELPAPANVQEGQRALVLKPSTYFYQGQQTETWETITSAKVESGKIKTTSPPFYGVTLAGALLSVSLLNYYVFIPARQRVVTGLVRKQKNDGTYETVTTGNCVILKEDGEPSELSANIQSNGRFTIGHNNANVPANQPLPVKCIASSAEQVALAYLWNSTEPGVSGFEVRYANIIYPATSIVNLPPQIYISAGTLNSDNTPVPENTDSLKLYGKTTVGSKIGLSMGIIPPTATITSQQLIINGSSQNLEFQCQDNIDSKSCSTLLPTPVAGRYSVVVKARTNINSELTETTAIYNFIVLNNPNVRPPISGVNPAVVNVTPLDGATQIDVGTSVHIEFTEPVKNLTEQTVYLEESQSIGERITGRILSGGIPVTSSDEKSVIDFIPNSRLKSGKTYKVVVTTEVIDSNDTDPDDQRHLDQDSITGGFQEFTSQFKTFEGAVITPTPINAQGYKIALLDDLVVTTLPLLNGLGSSGTLRIYDSNEFIGAEDPQNLQPIDSIFIPHVPLGLAVNKDHYTINGQDTELNLIAVTTLSMDTARPRNIWFYNIDESQQLHLVGVVSLIANGNSGQVPNSISIERKRAYIGSSSNGGVFVVDIQQALNEFSAADNTPNDGNDFNNNAVLKAVLPSTQPGGGGFALSALMQKAPYAGGNDVFIVNSVSAITQSLSPFAYVASSKQKLIGFSFSYQNDGRLGFYPGGQDGKDFRVAADKAPLPVSSFYDLKAVGGMQIQGQSTDIAVGVAGGLWIFNISNPASPKQYPIDPNTPQQPAKTFAELGVPVEFGEYGKQVEIEDTLVYVMFDNGIAVFDISNPNNPYLTTAIRGLTGLRRFAVKDGFIYSLGNDGLNVSIGRGVAQVVTYGYDPTAPDEVCGNPVVISKDEDKMVQPAGIFFQLFGLDTPQSAVVKIRKVETSGSTVNETELAAITVDPGNLRTISNPQNGFNIVTGHTFWENTQIVIDRNAVYTAEVIINDNFHSKRIEIPFSNLLPENLFQKDIKTNKLTTSIGNNGQGLTNREDVGSFTYLVAGNAVGVNFRINNANVQLYDSYPATRQSKGTIRTFGSNIDYLIPDGISPGLYPFTFEAKLKANPSYSEQVSGTVLIGDVNGDVRKPGSTVVGGVEINSGNLALSENDIAIKGRGLSLDLTRSYNSQASDRFGTLGYGWTHTYQVSLTHFPGGYQMIGGEGSGQTFLESNLQNGAMKAEEPYLGKLVKNADGTLDYFTKTQIKYHFRQPVEQGNPNVYLGNLEYIEEPNKNRITLSYDVYGRVASAKDLSNRVLNFEYEVAESVFTGINVGDVIQGTQGCPKISQFKQITRRLEQSVTGKAWRIKQVTGTNIGGLTIDYIYDEKGNLISVNRSGFDSTISEPTASREWKYSYNPTSTNGTGGDDKYAHLVKTVKSPNHPDSVVTEYKYFLTPTAPPRVQQILMPEGITNAFAYTYDQTTNIVESATFTDGNGIPTDYQLTDGRVHTVTAPLGAVTQLEWTDFGQIEKTTDPEGKITEIIYDENNNPITQKVTGTDGFSVQTETTFDTKFSKTTSSRDGNGNLTNYSINQTTGNIDEVTMPNGSRMTFRYFPNGDLKTVTDQYGTVTEYSNYDSYGNPQTITRQLGSDTQTITQIFDALSRMKSKSDSLGTDTVMDYDSFDRVVRQTNSDPAGYRNSLKVEMAYLPEGDVTLIVQKDGNTEINRTQNVYDKLQRITQTTETVSGYNAPFTRNFTYDNNSNVLTEQNRRGITTVKTYNALNYLTKIVQAGKTVWEATEIDRVGNPKTTVDLYGNQTLYVYDGLQRLAEKRLPENTVEKLDYDANNNISDSFDRNGNKTHFTFDGLNRIDSVTDALGRVTRWTYTDAEHKVTKETISRGLTETTVMDGLERPVSQTIRSGSINYQTTFEYDGRIVSVTDPRGTVIVQKLSGFGETGETEVIGANPAHKATAFYTALGGIRQMTDANNRVTTVVNDGFNRKRAVNINGEYSESWNYDGEGLMTSHTDRRGITSEMTYDELGRDLTVTMDNIEVSHITYTDGASTETRDSAVNSVGSRNSVTMKYDGLRRVKEVTNAAGDKKSFVYNGENLLEETDFFNQSSRKTRYVYDALNRVREIFDRSGGHARIDYSASDLVKTSTDRRGSVTTENYDALGRLTSADSYGKLASFTYDGNNNRLTQQDGLNNQTAFEYDKLDRLTRIVHAGGLQTEVLTYDAVGNVKTHNDGRGGVTENLLYDSLNQLRRAKDGTGNISEFQLDGEGFLLSKKDPKQNVTVYQYNSLGSVRQITEPGQAPWTLSYDEAQNIISVQDPLNSVTSYEYDAQNRLTKTKQPLGRDTVYEYDKNSNITRITDPKGQVTEMIYNALDNPETVTYKDEIGVPKISHQFVYDAEETLRQVTENRGGVSRSYTREFDSRNRLTNMTDAFGKTVKFAYDTANNLKSLTDAANRQTTYNYDAKNQLDTVVQNSATIADYDWFADGLLKKVAYQNQTSRNYIYDDADRVTNITNNFGNNQNESYDYGYDANSNRISEVRKENDTARRTSVYDYDALDRLTKADYTANADIQNPPAGQQAVYVENTALNTYGYDAVGNRTNESYTAQSKTITLTTDTNGQTTRGEETTTAPQQTTTATFDALNQLTQLNEAGQTSTFTYDLNGNLSEIKKNSVPVNKYEYDVRNQLTRALDGSNNELARFDYDFERKRLSKTTGSGTTNYIYAGMEVVNETLNNAFTASYTIGGGEIVKSEFLNGENNFHFTDALGSVTALANTSGVPTNKTEYDAFGLQTASNPLAANSIGYTGQRLDKETGLMALGNGERYYSPAYARFIQQDSWLGNNSMPQSLNRFSYAYNNPLKYHDPSGNEGIVADKLKKDNLNYNPNTGSESLDWWLRFGRSFVTGYTYDALNVSTLGSLGMVDVMAQDAVNGKISNPMDAWNRGGYGASPTQIAKNFAYFSAGVVKGVFNVAVGLPMLAYGLVTDPAGTAKAMYQGLAETTGSIVDTIVDPRAALDKLAQHSQEDIAFGVGETVGETVATMGVGAVSGKVLGYVGKILGRTKIGSAIGKVFTEGGTKISNKIGAVRQGIQSFEKKAFQGVDQKLKKGWNRFLTEERGSFILREGQTALKAGKTPLKEFDIDLYKNFNTKARRGDSLEGHELLQNKWLETNGYIEKRGKGIASRENPSVALSEPLHDLVGLNQRRLGLFDAERLKNMDVLENIGLNLEAMRRASIPEHIIQTLEKETLNHARKIGAINK